MIFHSAKDYSDYSAIGSTDQLIAMAQTAELCLDHHFPRTQHWACPATSGDSNGGPNMPDIARYCQMNRINMNQLP
jgi:hypothetical protein